MVEVVALEAALAGMHLLLLLLRRRIPRPVVLVVADQREGEGRQRWTPLQLLSQRTMLPLVAAEAEAEAAAVVGPSSLLLVDLLALIDFCADTACCSRVESSESSRRPQVRPVCSSQTSNSLSLPSLLDWGNCKQAKQHESASMLPLRAVPDCHSKWFRQSQPNYCAPYTYTYLDEPSRAQQE